MNYCYRHLSAEDRAAIMMMRATHSIRAIATNLRVARNGSPFVRSYQVLRCQPGRLSGSSDATSATSASQAAPRRGTLRGGGLLAAQVLVNAAIARTLRRMSSNDSHRQVSREAIYNALYVMPRGSLKKELVAYLRQGNDKHRSRSRGKNRHQQIPGLASIHMRPPGIEGRLMPGHWEGDLIMGANNLSAVGTLVERTTSLVILAKVDGTTATAAAVGFSDKLNEVPRALRLSMTYD